MKNNPTFFIAIFSSILIILILLNTFKIKEGFACPGGKGTGVGGSICGTKSTGHQRCCKSGYTCKKRTSDHACVANEEQKKIEGSVAGGAGIGAVIGAGIGASGGPPGIVVGALIGAVVGSLVGIEVVDEGDSDY